MNGRRVQGETKSEAGTRTVILPAFLHRELRWHLESYAEPGPDGLLFVGEMGAPFRRSTFGRKRRKAREVVGMPEGFRFHDLRHTGHTLSTRSGATLKDTMVRAGQSSEQAALIYQRRNVECTRPSLRSDSVDSKDCSECAVAGAHARCRSARGSWSHAVPVVLRAGAGP